MAGYSKNIAVLKGVRGGFSADGKPVSGLIKAEKFGTYLKAEATLINFAPLSLGRYVIGLSDGAGEEVFETEGFEGDSGVDTAYGFAAAVCFCGGGEVKLVAQAVCGDMAYAVDFAVRAVEMAENKQDGGSISMANYDDEAIAEDNYFEYAQQNSADEDGKGVRSGKEGGGEEGSRAEKDDADSNLLKEQKEVKKEAAAPEEGNGSVNNDINVDDDKVIYGGLARDLGFYEQVREEVEKLFASYPREEGLEKAVEGSRWVKITYGGNKFYVFGVINMRNKPRYLCYGVPALNDKTPPDSLKGMASYIPVQNGGYWVMYQDALTGASIPIASD